MKSHIDMAPMADGHDGGRVLLRFYACRGAHVRGAPVQGRGPRSRRAAYPELAQQAVHA